MCHNKYALNFWNMAELLTQNKISTFCIDMHIYKCKW